MMTKSGIMADHYFLSGSCILTIECPNMLPSDAKNPFEMLASTIAKHRPAKSGKIIVDTAIMLLSAGNKDVNPERIISLASRLAAEAGLMKTMDVTGENYRNYYEDATVEELQKRFPGEKAYWNPADKRIEEILPEDLDLTGDQCAAIDKAITYHSLEGAKRAGVKPEHMPTHDREIT